MSDSAGTFLRHVGGTPSYNLVTLVISELRVELRTALFQVAQSGSAVETRPLPIQRNGKDYTVKMSLQPVTDDKLTTKLIVVLFKEDESHPADAAEPEAAPSFIVNQLENELTATKEQLQSTIEQYETSSEELKASNESSLWVTAYKSDFYISYKRTQNKQLHLETARQIILPGHK